MHWLSQARRQDRAKGTAIKATVAASLCDLGQIISLLYLCLFTGPVCSASMLYN